MPVTFPNHISYSALSSYSECGERYRLSRGYHKDKATWYATVAGSTIHEITERYDLARDFGINAEADEPVFADVFLARLEREEARGVEVKASGRATKAITDSGGPNKKDRDWWLLKGPEYVARWKQWREDNPAWRLAIMPDGQPGVEVSVEAPMAGIPFKGYIDRVFLVDGFDIAVVDLKMGAAPSGKLQLGTYRVALQNQYGIDAAWGGYWMGKDGKFAGGLQHLGQYDREYVEHQYTMARRGIEGGVFLPNVTSMCKGCPVRDYCRAVGGQLAHEVPLRDEVMIRPAAA